jgi:hypothetical protein
VTQPFVVSLKLKGDGREAVHETREVRREIEALQRAAATPVASARQAAIDAAVGLDRAALGGRGADIEAYGAELDKLRARFNPLFAAEREHEANLRDIDRALRLGAISADEHGAAVDRERMAHHAAVAALDGHTFALNANNAAMARSNAQRTNLLFQLQDIGVSLASGMNPLMVFAQQGSQISMIYGPEEGGLGRALQETGKMATGAVTRLWPVALVVAAVAAGVAGMRHEIEETTGVAVSFGDTFMAVFQVLGGYIYDWLKPAIDAIAPWFASAWDWVVKATKDATNSLVRSVLGFFEQSRYVTATIPRYFELAGKTAANGFITSIEWLVQKALEGIDVLITGLNDFIDMFGGDALREALGWDLAIPTLSNPNEPFSLGVKLDTGVVAEQIAAIEKDFQARYGAIMTTDYAGQFFSDVQAQAIANYNGRLEDTDKAARAAASGLKIADDAAKAFKESMDFYRDTFRSFFTDMRQGLSQGQSFWEALGNAGANALDRIADRALGMAADGIFNMIVGAFMPGFGQTGGAWGKGLWGSAIFNAKGNVFARPALSAFSNQIVDRPTMFAFAKGAGIMGEAGAEAIIPLTRTASGDLGVRMTGAIGVGMSMGGVTYAPVNNFYGGTNMGAAEFARLLDERDRRLVENLPGILVDAQRRARMGVAA